MLTFIKDKFLYISIPKNGSTTFNWFLEANGWKPVMFKDLDLNLNEFIVWSHITDPKVRHTKGVVEYLEINKLTDIVDNERVNKMLVSGVFDVHTYSINTLVDISLYHKIHWIPLDTTITKWNTYPVLPEELNGTDLTNDFFAENGINLKLLPADQRHKANPKTLKLRSKIDNLKLQYSEEYLRLCYHILDSDMQLYDRTVSAFREKYQYPNNINK